MTGSKVKKLIKEMYIFLVVFVKLIIHLIKGLLVGNILCF